MKYTFVFDKYSLANGNELHFTYRYLDENNETIGAFDEYYRLPFAIDTQDATFQTILGYMHLIVGVSYYKSLLGDIVMPYELNASEAAYFNEVYDKGLGEYSFVNKLTESIRPFQAASASAPAPMSRTTTGAILGVGGGKDSIVAGELFKKLNIPTTTLDMATRENHGQAAEVMHIMGLPELSVERYVDLHIVKFNQQHNGMSGHVPLSTIIAWLGLVLAYTQNIRYIAMANEAATSTGNTMWNGREVNHQWAKSLEAEKLTNDFIRSHISPDFYYLSPIRPYGSLTIMQLLAVSNPQYLSEFTSCNLVLRIDPTTRPNGRWCTRCAKCLSTWLLLSTWLSTEQLVEIFGRNLWEDTELRQSAEELLGLQGHKPLDCVGTVEELRAAARNMLDKPLLHGITAEMIPGPSIASLEAERSEHNLPAELANQLEAIVTQMLSQR